jgi:RND family efflux transporter MFP subunit
MLNIPEAALGQVRIGQPVELQVEAMPGQTFTGTLTRIAAEVDERSRMAIARAEVPNPDATLKARMFARARVLTEESPNAVLLPASAVQKVAGRDIVFVQVADDLFEARAVCVGAEINGRVEITQGVEASDPVVVEHGFPLKSAFLISRLGAGCADD